ncbi:MAG: FumA C-terminus/TtdB family hydratase beta subunit [Candidatus Omnitrophica bacterium]|nr:FumA C-terminus/TtdB family hydratase beta subunit [Candidatus Omnitrophota bacterium]
MVKELTTPTSKKSLEKLRAGEQVLLSGFIYTARDQAHKRLYQMILRGEKLPLVLEGQAIYYCGPTKTPKGKIIGSCGPTTSGRMDDFTPLLLRQGLAVMIGKGNRSEFVRKAIKEYKAVYLVAPAGCGALLSTFVKEVSPIAFKDLGPEAIYRLKVEKMPLWVAIDSYAGTIFPKLNNRPKNNEEATD